MPNEFNHDQHDMDADAMASIPSETPADREQVMRMAYVSSMTASMNTLLETSLPALVEAQAQTGQVDSARLRQQLAAVAVAVEGFVKDSLFPALLRARTCELPNPDGSVKRRPSQRKPQA